MTSAPGDTHPLAPLRLSHNRIWSDWYNAWHDPWSGYDAHLGLLMTGYDCRDMTDVDRARRFQLYLSLADGYRGPISGSAYTESELAQVGFHDGKVAVLERARQLLAVVALKELIAHDLRSSEARPLLSQATEPWHVLIEDPTAFEALLRFLRPTPSYDGLVNAAASDSGGEDFLTCKQWDGLVAVIDRICDYVWGFRPASTRKLDRETKARFAAALPRLTGTIAGRGRLLEMLSEPTYPVTEEVLSMLEVIAYGPEQILPLGPARTRMRAVREVSNLTGVAQQAALVIIARSNQVAPPTTR